MRGKFRVRAHVGVIIEIGLELGLDEDDSEGGSRVKICVRVIHRDRVQRSVARSQRSGPECRARVRVRVRVRGKGPILSLRCRFRVKNRVPRSG